MGRKKIDKFDGKTRTIPLRIYSEIDEYIHKEMGRRQLNNRNLTINLLLREHKTVMEYKRKKVEKIRKEMQAFSITLNDLQGEVEL